MDEPGKIPNPPATTHIVFFDYVTGNIGGLSKEHTVSLRMDPDMVVDDAIDAAEEIMLDILTTHTNALFRVGWRIIRGRLQVVNTNFSLPFELRSEGLAIFAGQNNNSNWTNAHEAISWTHVGRSYTTGKRVRYTLFGMFITPQIDSNFRLTRTEMPSIGVVTTKLNGYSSLVTSDGTSAVWYPYMNVTYNAHWVKAIRRSG